VGRLCRAHTVPHVSASPGESLSGPDESCHAACTDVVVHVGVRVQMYAHVRMYLYVHVGSGGGERDELLGYVTARDLKVTGSGFGVQLHW
jgi:hypothetical protein